MVYARSVSYGVYLRNGSFSRQDLVRSQLDSKRPAWAGATSQNGPIFPPPDIVICAAHAVVALVLFTSPSPSCMLPLSLPTLLLQRRRPLAPRRRQRPAAHARVRPRAGSSAFSPCKNRRAQECGRLDLVRCKGTDTTRRPKCQRGPAGAPTTLAPEGSRRPHPARCAPLVQLRGACPRRAVEGRTGMESCRPSFFRCVRRPWRIRGADGRTKGVERDGPGRSRRIRSVCSCLFIIVCAVSVSHHEENGKNTCMYGCLVV